MAIKEQMQAELSRLSDALGDAYKETDAYESHNGPDHSTRVGMTNALRKFFANCDDADRVVATRFIFDRLLIDVWR